MASSGVLPTSPWSERNRSAALVIGVPPGIELAGYRREPHGTGHGGFQVGRRPRVRVAFGDGAADDSARDSMRAGAEGGVQDTRRLARGPRP